MFNGLFNLGNIFTVYSGSPLASAVSYATSVCKINGQIVPCGNMFSFMTPILIVLLPFLVFFFMLVIAANVLIIISWWKIFEKAGRPGWAAIVPIYNLIIMFQIVEMSPFWILLVLIPFVGSIGFFICLIFLNIKLAKAFGKDDGFAVGLILLPIVFIPILALGKSKFNRAV